MSIDVTFLSNNSVANVDANFQRVEAALEQALSRDGNAPNNMTADLDMDGHDIINIGSLGFEGGDSLQDLADQAAASAAAAAS